MKAWRLTKMCVAMSLALAAAVQIGCSSGRTFVLQPVHGGTIQGRVALKAVESTTQIDPQANKDLEAKLGEQLTKQVGVEIGAPADLVVEYRFVLYDTGSTGARLGSGIASLAGSPFYGIGDGSVGIEVVYRQSDGRAIGHIITDGPIAGAFGSTSGALDTAASAVAAYTKLNFTCPACGKMGVTAEKPTEVTGFKNQVVASGM